MRYIKICNFILYLLLLYKKLQHKTNKNKTLFSINLIKDFKFLLLSNYLIKKWK